MNLRTLLMLAAGICLAYGSLHAQTTNLLFDRESDFGISAGLVGSGEVSMDFDPYVTKKNASFLIKGFYDSYMIPKLSTGLYVQVMPASVNLHDTRTEVEPEYINDEWIYHEREITESYDIGVFIWEIGASIKTKYIVGKSFAIKPGLNMGYRKFYFNEDDLKAADVLWLFESEDQKPRAAGMAINGSVEFQYRYSEKMIFSSEVGFMTQPYGGTHHVTDLDFGPILYITLGVVR